MRTFAQRGSPRFQRQQPRASSFITEGHKAVFVARTSALARRSCYKAAMSTPIITARRNLAQRIANILRKAGGDELKMTPWQLGQVREAIE